MFTNISTNCLVLNCDLMARASKKLKLKYLISIRSKLFQNSEQAVDLLLEILSLRRFKIFVPKSSKNQFEYF